MVATLTINRPDRNNAFDLSMVAEMHGAWDEIEADPRVRVVIIRSALPRVFVAGGDIEAMRDLGLEDGMRFVYAGHELFRRLERSERVVIAAVGGYALGGGTELALACDLRVASTSAVFGQPETSLGLLPGWGGTQRLSRAIGESRAKDLILTARRIGAEEAYAIGLVNRLCQPEELDQEALDLANAILANAPMAVMRAKRAITEGSRVSLDQGLVIEAEAWLANLASPDRVEGLSAFLEKRKPRFASLGQEGQ
ncbi:MAG: enoyl-CoA hydratase/isomerase family protein [Dehalococcoidia bacterium]